MSNRMSVLSRRLERFAVGFSIATFAFFIIGLFAAFNTEGHVVFFFVGPVSFGLVSAGLFATFFLWLAHGFAWAMIPEKPVVATKRAEAMEPAEEKETAEAIRRAEAMEPAEEKETAEAIRPAEAMEPAEEKKPADEKVIAPEDSPDAKYTITGRRIY